MERQPAGQEPVCACHDEPMCYDAYHSKYRCHIEKKRLDRERRALRRQDPQERKKFNEVARKTMQKRREMGKEKDLAMRKTGILHPEIALSEYNRRLSYPRIMARARAKAESLYEGSVA